MEHQQQQQPFSILLVEDDEDARANIKDILALDGYHINDVSHCLPAIEAIEQRPYDVVVVDWRLPDGNGGDLISEISRQAPETPVIVVTGIREFDAAVTALRQGAYDFLLKPVNSDALRSVIARLLERKRHLSEIQQAQEKVLSSERLAAIGEMVAGLAHESRNAFQRSHACLAELSLDLQDQPESLALVNKVQKALDDIYRLLEEVRQYSAHINLERRNVPVDSLLEETWQQILEARRPETIPDFEIQRDRDFPETCFIDRDRMKQVFRNLLENALYACTEPGKIEAHLATESHSKPVAAISISDNGDGVPEDWKDSIFAPFFTTKTKGTGLGLAISKRIVEAHDGTLEVESSKWNGAKFVVEIPCPDSAN